MTGLQWAALVGVLIAGGVSGLVWWALPGTAALGPALQRLTGDHDLGPAAGGILGVPDNADLQDRLGAWSGRHLPAWCWGTPAQELALLRRSTASFYGEKLLLAVLGLVSPPLILGGMALIGVGIPVAVPIVGSLGAAAVLFWWPNLAIKTEAAAARHEFNHALSSYIDLVALERRAGAGPRQALTDAARVGHGNWVFEVLLEALAASSVDGRRPWEAFHDVAQQLGVPALDDLAAIMALAEQQNMTVYQALREHNRALRVAMRTDERTAANKANEMLGVPVILLVVVFVAILMGPQLMTMLANS